MSKYRFDTTTSFEGRVYFAGSEHDLSEAQARALGFAVVAQPKAEPEAKQVVEYENRQMTTKHKKKK